MGVFSRFLDIVNSNINALLDKAEDPEKLLKLMIQEMEDTLIELKSDLSSKLAQIRKLDERIMDQEEMTARWQSRAKLAVSKDRDDLAKEALYEKRLASEELERLKKSKAAAEELVKEYKEEISQLGEKLEQTKEKYNSVKSDNETRKKAKRTEAKGERETRFESMEARIDRKLDERRKEAESAAERFKTFEEDEEIEKELNELKQNKG